MARPTPRRRVSLTRPNDTPQKFDVETFDATALFRGPPHADDNASIVPMNERATQGSVLACLQENPIANLHGRRAGYEQLITMPIKRQHAVAENHDPLQAIGVAFALTWLGDHRPRLIT